LLKKGRYSKPARKKRIKARKGRDVEGDEGRSVGLEE
jgi:hypothetical protein